MSDNQFSTCLECGGRIAYTTSAGSGFSRKVWLHLDVEDWQDNPHPADPVNLTIEEPTS